MANPISSKDFFKGDIFGNQAQSAKNLAESVKELIRALEQLQQPIQQTAKKSKEFTDSISLKDVDSKKLVQLEKEYQKEIINKMK